jgi:hypothetical protein
MEIFMTRMNHQRVSMQKRIARENRPQNFYARRPTAPLTLNGWLSMRFGRYTGKILPTIFFRDPSYFFRYLVWRKPISEKTEGGKKLATQARKIAFKTRDVRPPYPYRKFAICFTHDGVFRRLKAIKDRPGEMERLKQKYGTVRDRRVLNVQKDLKLILLDGSDDPTATDCAQFFDDP